MNHDLVSLKMLIVSEVASERELVRQAAAEGSIPITVVEVSDVGDVEATCELLKKDNFDVVFMDSRMPKASRQTILNAAQAADGRPLAILIGAAEMKTREVLTDGLAIDGVLAKPIELEEVASLIKGCIRARLPNKVLIVDDSSTVRTVIRKVMQASRFHLEPEEANDGEAAIELAGRQQFDIIFLDCHMPGLDGFATLAALKKANPNTKAVMITGTRDVRIEDRARTDGAVDFMYKPFYGSDVDATLNRLFGLMSPRWN